MTWPFMKNAIDASYALSRSLALLTSHVHSDLSATSQFNPHWKMDKIFSPSYFSSQITYVEAEAVEFSRFCFRFHRRRIASTASASAFLLEPPRFLSVGIP